MDTESLLRKIPKMDTLLSREAVLSSGLPYTVVKKAARELLDDLRARILSGAENCIPDTALLEKDIIRRAREQLSPKLRRTINATGIVLHTNLGRAPFGDTLTSTLTELGRGYCNLEYDIETGMRGSRYSCLEELVIELTGAESVIVTNNNAAAVFLALNTLFKGRGVAVSRGELVEIGDSFRVPEIMSRSGANLIEVGTTNKTRISDYAAALESGRAEALLKVHASNFKMIGFTEETSLSELAELSSKKSAPLIFDNGAGLMLPLPLFRTSALTVKESISVGADIVCFSGDKLFGSAQAGIIVGRKRFVEPMKKNPFSRMFRPDKICLALLERTLLLYQDSKSALKNIPVLASMCYDADFLKAKSQALAQALSQICLDFSISSLECSEEAGGGAMPGILLPGWAVKVVPNCISVDSLAESLRLWRVPIVARIHKDALLLSPRTLVEGDEEEISAAFAFIASNREPKK